MRCVVIFVSVVLMMVMVVVLSMVLFVLLLFVRFDHNLSRFLHYSR